MIPLKRKLTAKQSKRLLFALENVLTFDVQVHSATPILSIAQLSCSRSSFSQELYYLPGIPESLLCDEDLLALHEWTSIAESNGLLQLEALVAKGSFYCAWQKPHWFSLAKCCLHSTTASGFHSPNFAKDQIEALLRCAGEFCFFTVVGITKELTKAAVTVFRSGNRICAMQCSSQSDETEDPFSHRIS